MKDNEEQLRLNDEKDAQLKASEDQLLDYDPDW
jgi:hypothetical protein